jgi:hypothetical protein
METTVKQRITEFIKYKNISVREFERVCGLSYGYINNMRVSIQPDKLDNIARCYPELNTGWVAVGYGNMLKPLVAATPPPEEYGREERLMRVIENQQRTIERLTRLIEKKDLGAYTDAGVADAG